MLKKVLKSFIFLPFIALFVGGWTFEVIDKPGNEHMIRGMQARDAGDNATAVAAFNAAIENSIDYQSKARAMTQIASIYLSQEPVSPAAAQKAITLLEQAEQVGYSRALLVLGNVYQNGTGAAPDYMRAYKYFSQVRDRFPAALVSMAELTADPNKARDFIVEAADMVEKQPSPSQEVMLRLARHFRDGTVVRANHPMAAYWYGRAAEGDSVSAIIELAHLWQKNGHQPKSDIINLWKRASALGNERATLELGFAYATGDGVAQNSELSQRYFARAVEAKPENAYRIARWYEELAATDAVYDEVAFEWFRIAAVKGHPDSIIRQARAYWSGERVPLDRDRAARLYQLAAQKGSDKALPELAERQLREKLQEEKRLAKMEEKERRRAIKARQLARKRAGGFDFWMPLAKSGNDSEAMLRVGEAYIQGNGVAQNAATGIDWMKKSASRGNGEAMYALAQVHSAGVGVPMDLKKAYEWYEKSANAGYAAGQYQLGLGYARGIGVSRDEQKARKWLNAASKNGYSQANKILDTLTGS